MSNDGSSRDLAGDMKWGVLWGLGIAACYFPLGLLKYHFTQADVGEMSSEFIGALAALILAAGAVVGAVVGLMRPLLRWGEWGAFLIGAMVTAPAITIVLLTTPELEQARDNAVLISLTIIIVSLASGLICGVGFYKIFSNDD